MAETDGPIGVDALTVRPPVRDQRGHAVDQATRDRLTAQVAHAHDAAHGLDRSSEKSRCPRGERTIVAPRARRAPHELAPARRRAHLPQGVSLARAGRLRRPSRRPRGSQRDARRSRDPRLRPAHRPATAPGHPPAVAGLASHATTPTRSLPVSRAGARPGRPPAEAAGNESRLRRARAPRERDRTLGVQRRRSPARLPPARGGRAPCVRRVRGGNPCDRAGVPPGTNRRRPQLPAAGGVRGAFAARGRSGRDRLRRRHHTVREECGKWSTRRRDFATEPAWS